MNGINTEAFKDPIIKKYNSSKELSAAERYRARPKLENNRDSLWRKSVYELFHRRRENDGQKLWDQLSESEKESALKKLGKNPEITRFKGLGEISPDEFKHFIGDDMRLEPVILTKDKSIEEILEFYMGKNTPDRQGFIIDNLKVEEDYFEEEKELT